MMFSIKNQIRRLFASSALDSFQLAGASWVVLLAARGFSMVEIGIAESVFHIASLLLEVPSGAFADVLGRKKTLMLGRVMCILSSLFMAFSEGMAGICFAMVFCAASYAFASGAREALAYDSLKAHGCEEEYLLYSSTGATIDRVGSASAVLCTGLALTIGYRWANLLDAFGAFACLIVLAGTHEVTPERSQRNETVPAAMLRTLKESLAFLRSQKRARRIMFASAFLEAFAVLLGFFLQARLQQTSLASALLGPALFMISLGGVLGAKLSAYCRKHKYANLLLFSSACIAIGVGSAMTDLALLMIAGGFLTKMFDSLLSVQTDVRLNAMFPSEQRATTISVDELCFSVIMIVLSPLAGLWFGSL